MGLVGDIKDVASLIQKADNIEIYRKMLDLQAEAMDLIDQLNTLKAENKELREKLNTQNQLIFRNNKYWIGEGETKRGPFCTKCWDVDRKLVNHQALNNGHYCCPNCRMTVEKEDYVSRSDRNGDGYTFW